MNKYMLDTTQRIKRYGVELFRIKALKSFSDVKEGDFGGWVQSEANLSQDGDAWIYDDGIVCHDARLKGNATVRDAGAVYGYATVKHNAKVRGHAQVFGYSLVNGKAEISGHGCVYHYAKVGDEARVIESARVCDYASVEDHAVVGSTCLVYDNAQVYGYAKLLGDILCGGDARVSQHVVLRFPCVLGGNANIRKATDVAHHVYEFNGTQHRLTICHADHGYLLFGSYFTGTLNGFIRKSECSIGDVAHNERYHEMISAYTPALASIQEAA